VNLNIANLESAPFQTFPLDRDPKRFQFVCVVCGMFFQLCSVVIQAESLPGKVEKIWRWRWKEETLEVPSTLDDDAFLGMDFSLVY